jgi:hypothetical protein
MAFFQTYSLSNGQRRQNPRALIDAYGNDRTCGSTLNKVISTSWQNTEEQEFDWKDMNRPPVLPAPRPCPLKNPVRNPSESINVANSTIVSHGFPNFENNDISKRNLMHQLPNQPAGLISSSNPLSKLKRKKKLRLSLGHFCREICFVCEGISSILTQKFSVFALQHLVLYLVCIYLSSIR